MLYSLHGAAKVLRKLNGIRNETFVSSPWRVTVFPGVGQLQGWALPVLVRIFLREKRAPMGMGTCRTLVKGQNTGF